MSNDFNCNDGKQNFKEMKPQIYRRHPLNGHFVRATIAEDVSKQNSHPFNVMQKWQSCGFLYGHVYLSHASYVY